MFARAVFSPFCANTDEKRHREVPQNVAHDPTERLRSAQARSAITQPRLARPPQPIGTFPRASGRRAPLLAAQSERR